MDYASNDRSRSTNRSSITQRSVILDQDFESVSVGGFPDDWSRDGNESQSVVERATPDGTRALELQGSHGGCWEALANAPAPLPSDAAVSFEALIRPSTTGAEGCHSHRASLALRTEVGSWSAGKGVKLLSFRTDGTIVGRGGLDLGEYEPDRWYDVRIGYENRGEEVALVYDIDGSRRGETVVSSADHETDLEWLRVRSGEFTVHFDAITVAETDGVEDDDPVDGSGDGSDDGSEDETTEDDSGDRSDTVTEEEETLEYELREGSETRVDIGYQTVFVVEDIPETDDGVRAVTTTDYDLVDDTTAFDALVTHYWGEMISPIEWESRLDEARRRREYAARMKLFGRALDFGWDALETYAFVQTHPPAAVGPALDLMVESINWAVEEITDPYQEAFSKMTATLGNVENIDRRAHRVDSRAEFGTEIETLLEATVLAKDAVQSGSELAGAWSQVIDVVRNGGRTTVDVTDSTWLIVSFAVDATVGELDGAVKTKTKIHAAEHAYQSVRIPLIERIVELETKAEEYRISPLEAIEYEIAIAADFQMGALAFALGELYWTEIADMRSGAIWDVVADATERANACRDAATDQEEAGKWTYVALGAGWDDVERRFERSINADVNGGDD